MESVDDDRTVGSTVTADTVSVDYLMIRSGSMTTVPLLQRVVSQLARTSFATELAVAESSPSALYILPSRNTVL